MYQPITGAIFIIVVTREGRRGRTEQERLEAVPGGGRGGLLCNHTPGCSPPQASVKNFHKKSACPGQRGQGHESQGLPFTGHDAFTPFLRSDSLRACAWEAPSARRWEPWSRNQDRRAWRRPHSFPVEALPLPAASDTTEGTPPIATPTWPGQEAP